MIYLKIENNTIIQTSIEAIEGFESYEGTNENEVLVNPASYEYINNQWVNKWRYAERPIKLSMTYKQAAELAIENPAFAVMAKERDIPMVMLDGGVDYYFEYMEEADRGYLETTGTVIDKI